jgi:hypothetical protein
MRVSEDCLCGVYKIATDMQNSTQYQGWGIGYGPAMEENGRKICEMRGHVKSSGSTHRIPKYFETDVHHTRRGFQRFARLEHAPLPPVRPARYLCDYRRDVGICNRASTLCCQHTVTPSQEDAARDQSPAACFAGVRALRATQDKGTHNASYSCPVDPCYSVSKALTLRQCDGTVPVCNQCAESSRRCHYGISRRNKT